MSTLKNIVIAGASLAGLRAAEALRREGYAGHLAMIGGEKHLPYDRPPLSKEILRGDWEPEKTSLRPKGYDDLEIEWHLGQRAEELDTARQTVRLTNDTRLDYDGLIIATGCKPRNLPNFPAASEVAGLYTLRTLDDALTLRQALTQSPRVVIIGAGFIGAEVASSCRTLGLEVDLVEAMPLPLEPKIGFEMATVCSELHSDNGVRLHYGRQVSGIQETQNGKSRQVAAVKLSDGTILPADVVLVGVGVEPETSWLENSGLELNNGVVCDSRCATSVPNIVAAGDIARWYNPLFNQDMRVEHWTHAVEQSEAAAKRLLHGENATPEFSSAPLFWSDQYGVKIQFAGNYLPGDEMQIVHGDTRERRFTALYGRAGKLTGVFAMKRPRHAIRYRMAIADGTSWEDALAIAQEGN